MNISGGSITAYSIEGDGFDSNGDLNISGGTVVVWTANRADNQPLDADGTLSVTGGTVLAAGGSNGMGISISAEQAFVTFGSSGGMGGASTLVSKGDLISVKDASGNTLYSGAANFDAGYVFFSSADLSDGAATACTQALKAPQRAQHRPALPPPAMQAACSPAGTWAICSPPPASLAGKNPTESPRKA